MITKENFRDVLKELGFTNTEDNDFYTKHFDAVDCDLKVDFKNEKLIFPTEKGFEVNDGTTSNFSHPENFVVFECVTRLLLKGYRPEHIELEPRWSLGHGGKSGKADICVKNQDNSPYLCIIECKTADGEYKKELSNMKTDGGQLFSYWQQSKATKWLVLYASDYSNKITYTTCTINCSDDANIVELAKDDSSLKLYKDATTVETLFEVWKETYEQKLLGDLIFDEETIAYNIGVLPLKKKRLIDFNKDDKIVNQFEEILRHNNVSDKENAFNRLIALFIAKLHDEKKKTPEQEVDFQYKIGTDTYQTMQDRLQKLHHYGMKEFMKEEVFYVADDYVKTTLKGALGENREKLEEELNDTITKLKFYTNNDFAFKDVHNKALFYQNGKILVEMVELFQKYRIVDSEDLQFLGDMFEQLLNKGFKQNEGQFFTPVPITSFIWKCLPLETIINKDGETNYPKIIDYACGAGHFLTEGFSEVKTVLEKLELEVQKDWEQDCIFGIEKDYRLARVSKISMFMHGADNANIIFGDGLDNHDKEGITIENGKFDILVANPPYSVKAFAQHLELKNNSLELVNFITKDGSEIETLFVERIAQLLKPKGVAAVILPSSILSNSSTSYIKAREVLLKNFQIKSIVCFGSKTFGATGTNTVVLFLQKNDEPPVKSKIVNDNVNAIFENQELNIQSDIKILDAYLQNVGVVKADYIQFVKDAKAIVDYDSYKDKNYFAMYVKAFEESAEYKTALKKDEKTGTKESRSKAFYDFVLKIEKDKIYYFVLSYTQKVLVVTAPNDNSEQEKFLGYTWSNRKGDEGIKLKNEDVKTECGLLYNTNNKEKSIARYVKDAFSDNYPSEGEMQKYVNVHSLCDMIDFSRLTFDKAIKTSVTKKVEIVSKYELVKLGEVAEIDWGNTDLTKDYYEEDGIYDVYSASGCDGKSNTYEHTEDAIVLSAIGARCGKCYLAKGKWTAIKNTIVIKPKNNILLHYLFENINNENYWDKSGSAQPFIALKTACTQMIPLPPKDIQQQIVRECEEVDKQYSDAQKTIEECKAKIESIMENAQKKADVVYKLSNKDVFDISIGRRILSTEMNENYEVPVYSANVFEPFGKINKLLLTDFSVPSILWGIDGDWMVNVISKNQHFYPTDHCGVLRIKSNQLETKYVAWVLNKFGKKEGFKRSYRASIDRIEALSLTLPSLDIQKESVEQINNLDKQIKDANVVLQNCPKKKQDILDKYLK